MTALQDIARGRSLPGNNAPVVFTRHCLEQANARAFHHLDLERTKHELARLSAEQGIVSQTAPDWLPPHIARKHKSAIWLVIESLQLAFPICSQSEDGALVAATALAPMEHSVGATVRFVYD